MTPIFGSLGLIPSMTSFSPRCVNFFFVLGFWDFIKPCESEESENSDDQDAFFFSFLSKSQIAKLSQGSSFSALVTASEKIQKVVNRFINYRAMLKEL